ncbi:starch synthase [Chlorobium sp. BLA1]|uniref:starch synthase n=1 Tax=Candidatus Chlorobium masyuteum TaxID=2716876 RepID=UPI00141DB2AC|nr:starch synthase [Candidatus Chlorobium masyuteum]NHQ59416.1 starch synthase [Candidatus Chlorobium masyuteum]NTU45733.1 starch synthase [Chlorobiaceae bacterium]
MSRRNFKVLYVSGEVSPFVRISALADFMASFPQALEEEGFEARIMMPKYGTINDRKFRLHDVLRLSDIEVHLKEKTDLLNVKVTALPSSKIQTYFLYNEKYFKRNGLFTDIAAENDLKATAEKVIFFNVGVLETLQRLGWKPDIIHCHDWQASLIPLLLKTVYADHEFFREIKTVLTIHNIYRQGILPFKVFQKQLPEEVSSALHRKNDEVNMLYTGVENVDLLTTTSKRYAEEIVHDGVQTYGLGRVLEEHQDNFHGIVNGIDTRQWNPSTDKLIKKRFGLENMEGKLDNKKTLLEEAGLPYREGVPVVGVIANFDEFQGAELLQASLEQLVALDIQLVIYGSGDKKYEKVFQDFAAEHPEQVSVQTEYSDTFFHLAIAGLDILLMPGMIEACGMIQMFAMNYGTIPVVYAGGGIVETIDELSGSNGSGFIFHEYTPEALTLKLQEAIECYQNGEFWQQIVSEAMNRDFAWKNSAEEYGELYRKLLEKP